MKYIIVTAAVFSILIVASSCKAKKSTTNNCVNSSYTYEKDVQPIIQKSCASSCHSAASNAAGIDLSTYEKTKLEASMPRFLGAIRHLAGYSPMPKKNPQLTDSLIQVITCWKETGFTQ